MTAVKMRRCRVAMSVRCCQLYNCDSEKRRASKRILTSMLLENFLNSDTSMQGTDREPHAPQAHSTASRRLHSTASAASSSCCRCGGGFRPCSCRNCRRLASSLTSSQMQNVVLLRNFNVVTLLPCRFVRASAIMLSGTQRRLARKACMLRRNTQSPSAARRR